MNNLKRIIHLANIIGIDQKKIYGKAYYNTWAWSAVNILSAKDSSDFFELTVNAYGEKK